MDKAPTVKLTYFKNTGKFYTDATCRRAELGVDDDAYGFEVHSRVQTLRKQGASLPGLSTSWTTGYVLIECEPDEPQLLFPLEAHA